MLWAQAFLILLLMQCGSDTQNLEVTVVEGTLHAEYHCTIAESRCVPNDSLQVSAHISWITEKEKTTHLQVLLTGTPYTELELAEIVGPLHISPPGSGGISIGETEDISTFWQWWFASIEPYGFFSEFSETVMLHWDEVEVGYTEDSSGCHYSLVATYYDYFTKFYPTPEDFFDDRNLNFQLIFGIRSISPAIPLEITLTLPESASQVRVAPQPSSQVENTITWRGAAGETISPIRTKFKMGRYQGTTLPKLEVLKTASSDRVTVGEEVKITITVTNTTDAAAYNVCITDDIPDLFILAEGTTALSVETLAGNGSLTLSYLLNPISPGDFVLPDPHVMFEDQFGREYHHQPRSEGILLSVVDESSMGGLFLVGGLIFFLFLLRRKR